jgi:hypothetical protein
LQNDGSSIFTLNEAFLTLSKFEAVELDKQITQFSLRGVLLEAILRRPLELFPGPWYEKVKSRGERKPRRRRARRIAWPAASGGDDPGFARIGCV